MAGPVQMPEYYPYGLKTLTPGNTIVEALAFLTPGSFQEVPLASDSPYVKPKSVLYQFNGKQRRWDIVEAMPSVGIVLYHRDLDSWLVVRQFRPAVYASLLREAAATGQPAPPYQAAFTYELCAGLIDKVMSNKQVAKEEIMEECGFDVPLDAITEISVGVTSAGNQGVKHHIYYVEVDSSMVLPGGGGGLISHGECIEVLALPFDECQPFVLDSSLPKSPGLMFGLTWAYYNKLAGKLGAPRKASSDSNPLYNGELTLKSVLPA